MLASAVAFSAAAEENAAPKRQNAGQKAESEMVAFLTVQMDLSVEEAQAFWPVYNKIEKEQDGLRKAEREAFKALNSAVREGKPANDLLNAYLAASKANVNLHAVHQKDYSKVLSEEKLAKFYVAQERFRRMQINKLKGCQNGGHHGPHNGGHGVPAQHGPGPVQGR